jgi:hypothetical protein
MEAFRNVKQGMWGGMRQSLYIPPDRLQKQPFF